MRPRLATACILTLMSSLATAAVGIPVERGEAQRQHMQSKRHAAQASISAAATPAQLRAAASRFEGLIAELDQPAMRDLANGNTFLRAERLNNLIPLAEVYLRLGDKEHALSTLEQSQQTHWLPTGFEQNPAFAALASEPQFMAINAKARLARQLFDVPALATNYREALSVEERIAGLSLFWHEARQSFAHFDHVPALDWDKVYLEYIGKVMAANTTREYYDVMMQLAPLLQDGHTNIYPPDELIGKFYARPPIQTMLVEDKVIVTEVGSPSLDALLKVGDEILSIDGIAVNTYAQQRVAPYASSSTAQDKLVRVYNYQLLAGDEAVPVQLSVAGADGKVRSVTLARSGYTDRRHPPAFEFKMLPGGVAYIALDHFESDAGPKAFKQALPQIMQAKALIIDVRKNGGGSTEYGTAIIRHLSNQPINGATSYARIYNPVQRAHHGNVVEWQRLDSADDQPARHEKIFSGPVVVLAGPQSFSAAEDFLVEFAQLKRGPIIGEASAGSTGQPLHFALPGGGAARICVKRDTFRDGRLFVGLGVQPTIEVRPTLQSVRSGQDPVLQEALRVLKEPSGTRAAHTR
ncbi:S41 family peptidase [Duganella fentianensis]|uniref:S41 family peptidase n=1 Tax=Duganella fentianensis TaxID=2692177 RepID=UPI0032B22DD5